MIKRDLVGAIILIQSNTAL